MKCLTSAILFLISHSVWSQGPIRLTCGLTDVITGKMVEGEMTEVDLVSEKSASIYAGTGQKRVLRTTLKYEKKGSIPQVVPAGLGAAVLKKDLKAKDAIVYSSKSERGSEYFLQIGDNFYSGYSLDRNHPVLKEVMARGGKFDDHFFSCVKTRN